MQRLFSTFPAGAAGVALIALRGAVAGSILMEAVASGSRPIIAGAAVLACGLLPGVLTPVLCAIAFFAEMAALTRVTGLPAMQLFLLGVTTAALGALGPGSYSIDGLIFARRRLIVPRADKIDRH